eukprot:2621797-Karenia_brevis.AAC.1
MFGQTTAVYAFLRFSKAIAALAASMLDLCVVEFFDDFTLLEPKGTADSAQSSFSRLLKILGWREARDKDLDFAEVFVSLGAEVDLGSLSSHKVIVRNKPGRVEDIVKLLDQAILKPHAALLESLKGKFIYAESNLFGRLSATLIHSANAWIRAG